MTPHNIPVNEVMSHFTDNRGNTKLISDHQVEIKIKLLYTLTCFSPIVPNLLSSIYSL